MTAHRITIEPVGHGERGNRYRIQYAGGVLLDGAREPLLDACRALAAQGITGRLEMWRPGKAHPDMTADITRAAKITVAETADRSPVFVPWRAWSEEAGETAPAVLRDGPRTPGAEIPAPSDPRGNREPTASAATLG